MTSLTGLRLSTEYFEILNTFPPDSLKVETVPEQATLFQDMASDPTLEMNDFDQHAVPRDHKKLSSSAKRTNAMGIKKLGKSSLEKIDKRRQQSRDSSRVYRKNKKKQFEELFQRAQTLEAENDLLKRSISRLEAENILLNDSHEQMQQDFSNLYLENQWLKGLVASHEPASVPASSKVSMLSVPNA